MKPHRQKTLNLTCVCVYIHIYLPSSTVIMQTGGRDVKCINTPSFRRKCDITLKRSRIVSMKTGGCGVIGVLLPHKSRVLYNVLQPL